MSRGLCKARLLSVALVMSIMSSGCTTLILRKDFPLHQGALRGLPLHHQVEIIRDRWGIPHIYARDEHDLFMALGFVHAQDRLWQMEVVRRLSQGRLSEIAGEATLKADFFVRLLGFPELRLRIAEALSQEERELLQAYADGVNSFIELRSEQLPVEFRFTGLKPGPWVVEDCFSSQVVISWMMQTNYQEEMFALKTVQALESEQYKELFPSFPHAVLPEDRYFDRIRGWKTGPLLPEAFAFNLSLPEGYLDESEGSHGSGLRLIGGSNSWVVTKSQDGMPLLANDPHLVQTVPQIWYFCHLSAPGVEVAGASMAGSPGILIGHNRRVAWGLTNLMADYADLFLVQVDSSCPTRYRVGDRFLDMEEEKVVIGLPKGQTKEMTIYHTLYGPVLSRLEEGIEAAVSLKWYGTLKRDVLEDHTFRAFLLFSRARNAREVLAAGEKMATISMNIVAADTEGHIGWHPTGVIPIRKGYSGRLPADGSAGTMEWMGFLPYNDLPSSFDPARGWIVSSNQRVVNDEDSHPISFSWSAPYRYERIAGELERLASPSVADFGRLQMDVHSLQAERLLPKIFSYRYRHCKARRAIKILEEWDHEVRAESRGAAVYEVFLTQWIRALLEDELGEDLAFYYYFFPLRFSIHDTILDRPESPFWDRIDTPERECPGEILELALMRTMDWLYAKLGRNTTRWTWGRLHTYEYRHPGAKIAFFVPLLNRGPFPAPGDNTTVNPGYFAPTNDRYTTFAIPSVRMIVPLGDLDRTQIMGPMGQSGNPGHPHYDDMIRPWIEGETATLAFSRHEVERSAASRLFLSP